MLKKILTKDCPSCDLVFIDDDSQFRCKWGNSKKGKVLTDAKGKPKGCKLKVESV